MGQAPKVDSLEGQGVSSVCKLNPGSSGRVTGVVAGIQVSKASFSSLGSREVGSVEYDVLAVGNLLDLATGSM